MRLGDVIAGLGVVLNRSNDVNTGESMVHIETGPPSREIVILRERDVQDAMSSDSPVIAHGYTPQGSQVSIFINSQVASNLLVVGGHHEELPEDDDDF